VNRYTCIDSPLGELLVARDDVGLTALKLPSGRHRHGAPAGSGRDHGAFADVRAELAEYFAGERTTFNLALNATATPFQRKVWDALVRIPCGETSSYGELAQSIGSPGGARAVGLRGCP